MSFSYASCLPRILGLGGSWFKMLELRLRTVELQTKCCKIGAISMKHSNKMERFSSESAGKCMNNMQQRLEPCLSQFHWEDYSINGAPCVQPGTWGRSLSRSSLTPKVRFQERLIFSQGIFLTQLMVCLWDPTRRKGTLWDWHPQWDQRPAFGQQPIAMLGSKSWWWLLCCSSFLAYFIKYLNIPRKASICIVNSNS